MKRIVDGVTYNTDTATRLARRRSDGANESEKVVQTLYQTRGGAFFIVAKRSTVLWDERERESVTGVERTFVPINHEKAQRWMLEGEVHIFRNPFGDPPEAAAEVETGATIYIRVPASLKRDADAAAREQKLSSNIWAMRCIERSLEGTSSFGIEKIAPLVHKILDGDKELPICFQNAKIFWDGFFEKNSQLSVPAMAKELERDQRKFESIFKNYRLSFAREMMPLTCLSVLHSEKNKKVPNKVVKAFLKSDLSAEIKNAHLKAAIQFYPLD